MRVPGCNTQDRGACFLNQVQATATWILQRPPHPQAPLSLAPSRKTLTYCQADGEQQPEDEPADHFRGHRGQSGESEQRGAARGSLGLGCQAHTRLGPPAAGGSKPPGHRLGEGRRVMRPEGALSAPPAAAHQALGSPLAGRPASHSRPIQCGTSRSGVGGFCSRCWRPGRFGRVPRGGAAGKGREGRAVLPSAPGAPLRGGREFLRRYASKPRRLGCRPGPLPTQLGRVPGSSPGPERPRRGSRSSARLSLYAPGLRAGETRARAAGRAEPSPTARGSRDSGQRSRRRHARGPASTPSSAAST